MKLNLTKKIVSILLLFLLCFNSFAAVVSDNDGSAFITKAEFDSLKNDFQAQIDNYNQNIDNKIDAAIASYLAGIKVETVEELDSYLNKINGIAEDFYLDSSGNKVKYGYRCMARRYNIKTTQKPVGAITNLMIIRANNSMNDNDTSRSKSFAMARVSMNHYNRTSIGDVHVPKDNYQIGKYMMIKKRSDGTFYPFNQYDDVTYRYYIGGQSFTYDVNCSFPAYGGSDPSAYYSYNGTWTHDEMKNEDKFWGLKIGNAKWVWEQQINQSYNYDNMRTIYGGAFEYSETPEVFPLVAYTASDIYALDNDRLAEQALESVSYDRHLRLDRGLDIYQCDNIGSSYNVWVATGQGAGDPDYENPEDPGGATVPWTFYFNHHPYQTLNTRNLVDNAISQVLGRSIKLTSGIPVCKATMDGIIDIKMEFMGNPAHSYACGWQKKEFEPNDSIACQIDSSLKLRNFDDESISSSTVTVGSELNFRMNVSKGDTIWIRCVDTSDQYGFVGAKTNSIKNTKKDN